MKRLMIMLSLLIFSLAATAHPGGTDASGCHNNRKTNQFHCHKGKPKKSQKQAEKSQKKGTKGQEKGDKGQKKGTKKPKHSDVFTCINKKGKVFSRQKPCQLFGEKSIVNKPKEKRKPNVTLDKKGNTQ